MVSAILYKITKKIFTNFNSYKRILLILLRNGFEHPGFYLKDYLNIIKSLILKFLNEFPHVKFDYISRKINGVYFNFYFHFNPRYRGMFLGLNSLPVVNALLSNLKKGSIFLDAGANVGYISAIGASLVGKKGEVHSFEPVPLYYQKLFELKRLNPRYKINTNNFALGNANENSKISLSKDIMGDNTLISTLLIPERVKEVVQISVQRLDDYIIKNELSNISLIKVDVEGYELLLLEGLTKYLEKVKLNLPTIVLEVNPSAYPFIGKSLNDLKQFIDNYNYIALSIDEKRILDVANLKKLTDIILKQKNM